MKKQPIKKLHPTFSNIFLAGSRCVKDIKLRYLLLKAHYAARIEECKLYGYRTRVNESIHTADEQRYLKEAAQAAKERWATYKNDGVIIHQQQHYYGGYFTDPASQLTIRIMYSTSRKNYRMDKPRIVIASYHNGLRTSSYTILVSYTQLKKYLTCYISVKRDISKLKIKRVQPFKGSYYYFNNIRSTYLNYCDICAFPETEKDATNYQFTEADEHNIVGWDDL